MCNLKTRKRILILGSGFGGVATARHLERLFRRRRDVEIVLIGRDNFVLMTPLLFEVFSGTLDLQSCSVPIRAFLRSARFIEASVQSIDLDRRMVRLAVPGTGCELAYDQLIIALGSKTNRDMIPGSEHAFTFKTLADALLLRNYVIERFERADVETDPARRAQLLTCIIIGGGLVGVELLGELTAFVDGIAPLYEHVDRDEVRFILFQGGDRIMPEIDPTLAAYASQVLAARRGVEIRTNMRVRAIEPRKVHLADESIAADTIVLAAGVVPNPVVTNMPVQKDRSGRMLVEPTMRCPSHPDVWAVGDCASIPGPDGKPYPPLAQHAIREARVLAENLYNVLNDRSPQPFIHDTLGMMGSLGHNSGFGQFLKVRLHGFPAWFARRTYYLLQMPGWSRRLRMMIDWTFGLLFRPDVVKVGLDTETASLLREIALGEAASPLLGEGGPPAEPAAISRTFPLSDPKEHVVTHQDEYAKE
jgi:NADH:quinone reductase (non-electrogenic)